MPDSHVICTLGKGRPAPTFRQSRKVGAIRTDRLFVFLFPIRRGFLASLLECGQLFRFPMTAAISQNPFEQVGCRFLRQVLSTPFLGEFPSTAAFSTAAR